MQCPQGLEKGTRNPKTGVTDACELHVSPQNKTQILFKSSKCFLYLLSHLSNSIGIA